ncbi:hypothetical protein [Microcoleus sp. FACHB-68]|uniref:hypothetical protein n=1 Tax=Microcoleus sp. FACHB-68 TaxID=2692826 RepID=UPI001F555B07|nr:hypothetical protein [Microcoleus sp. FACHB-68]
MHNRGLYKRSKWLKVCGWTSAVAVSVVAIGFWNHSDLRAQPASVPLFETITLSPKFKPDPKAISGISGGSIPAEGIAGRKETANGPCVGFLDKEPDHVLTLTAFFNYLSIQVESTTDTTLLIRGPGGSWCNDDSPGRSKNPGIAGQWLEGTYQVWIGSYEPNKYHPYVIKITTEVN